MRAYPRRPVRRFHNARAAAPRITFTNTGMGVVYLLARALGIDGWMRAQAKSSWHMADLYKDGHYRQPVYMYPKESHEDYLNRKERLIQVYSRVVKGETPAANRRKPQ